MLAMNSLLTKRFSSSSINIFSHLKAIEHKLLPPVANSIFNGKIKVMAVGGPTNRRDYHLPPLSWSWRWTVMDDVVGEP